MNIDNYRFGICFLYLCVLMLYIRRLTSYPCCFGVLLILIFVNEELGHFSLNNKNSSSLFYIIIIFLPLLSSFSPFGFSIMFKFLQIKSCKVAKFWCCTYTYIKHNIKNKKSKKWIVSKSAKEVIRINSQLIIFEIIIIHVPYL